MTLTENEDDSPQQEDGKLISISDECFNVQHDEQEYHFELLTRCGSMKYYTSDMFFAVYFHGKYHIYKILSDEKESVEDGPEAPEGAEG